MSENKVSMMCPRCGSQSFRLKRERPGGINPRLWFVECNSCNRCEVRGSFFYGGESPCLNWNIFFENGSQSENANA